MRIESSASYQRPAPTEGLALALSDLRECLQLDAPPTLLELLLLSVMGVAFGFAVAAYAMQVILLVGVVTLGLIWGMVLGLLLDRVRLHLAST